MHLRALLLWKFLRGPSVSAISQQALTQLTHQRLLPPPQLVAGQVIGFSTVEVDVAPARESMEPEATPNSDRGLEITAQDEPVKQNKGSDNIGNQSLSKKALKRLARAQKHKELRQQKKALTQAQRDDAGYKVDDFDESSYYFENGLRKVYPYHFVFSTYAKGRWVGRTVEHVLQNEFGFDHEDDLSKAFKAGHIHVNHERVGPNYILRDCDFMSHRTHRHENPVTWAPIEIIKDTNELIVINKPSSIPCHPCGRYRFNSVVFILGKEMGYTNLRNIYRLDRLTSGVLILAKTVQMTKTLEDQVVNRQVQKEYVCRVVGKFPEDPVRVDQPLRPLSNKLRLQVVCPKGKASQTDFELISYNGTSSVVRCRPFTGRTHQIRVHLQFLGHPIINDAFYNNPAWGPDKGKGGHYQVPFEKVCERILREHHVNLWDGGENPLYYVKLKEMEEKMNLETPELIKEDGKTEPPCKKSRIEGEPCGEKNELKSSPSEKDLEHPIVLTDSDQILSSSITSDEISGPKECGNGVQVKTSQDDSTSSNTKELSRSTSILSNHAKQSDPISAPTATATQQQDETVCQQNESQDLSTQGISSPLAQAEEVTRPGFDISKWSVDPSCELCKKLAVDPEEKHLVMFLHALKYKGPGWEYETQLPQWAEADWNREDEYVNTGGGLDLG